MLCNILLSSFRFVSSVFTALSKTLVLLPVLSVPISCNGVINYVAGRLNDSIESAVSIAVDGVLFLTAIYDMFHKKYMG